MNKSSIRKTGMNRHHRLTLLVTALLALLLAGCTAASPTPIVSTPDQPATQSIAPTNTPEPSPTPQAGKAVLYSPAGSDVQAVQSLLTDQIAPSGLTLETVTEPPAGLGQEVKLVVMLTPPANLADLLSAAPQAQFVVVSGADLPTAANLSVIRQRPEYQAFLGGFVSTLLSTDWRAAALVPTDGPLGASLQDAFVNGGRYFCGACAPGWPLGVYFPQVSALPAASDGPSWQAAATTQFDTNKVEVFYLSAEAARPEVVSYLQGKVQVANPVLVVGTQPPLPELREQWAATVGFDVLAPMQQLLPEVLSGKGGTVVDAQLEVQNVNEAHLGAGKIRLVDELIKEIEAGRIYPYSVPLE